MGAVLRRRSATTTVDVVSSGFVFTFEARRVSWMAAPSALVPPSSLFGNYGFKVVV
jgi:hypothetical protein